MFVKVFAQILDSTVADDWQVRHVFEDLFKLADYKTGIVDMTLAAISRRTGVPLEIVTRAVDKLSQPDPESRSTEEDGRRIVLLDPHRSWGWRVVNYEHYRGIRDEEDRKAYFRERKRIQRARDSSPQETPVRTEVSRTVKDNQRPSKHVTHTDSDSEAEAESEAEANTSKPPLNGSSESIAGVATEIYERYPRKIGRAEAIGRIQSAIRRLVKGEHQRTTMSVTEAHNFLLNAVALFSASSSAAEAKFIPYPATWFGKSRYLDDPADWDLSKGATDANGNRNAHPAASQKLNSVIASTQASLARIDGMDFSQAG